MSTTTTERPEIRRTMTVAVASLRAGDLAVTSGSGTDARLEVARVLGLERPGCLTVEFVGGARTRPLMPLMLVTVERAMREIGEGGAL